MRKKKIAVSFLAIDSNFPLFLSVFSQLRSTSVFIPDLLQTINVSFHGLVVRVFTTEADASNEARKMSGFSDHDNL